MEIFEYIYQDNYDPFEHIYQDNCDPFEHIYQDNYDPNAELRAWEEKDPKYLEFLKKTNQLKEE